jgi:hypothetical protein
MQRFETPFDKVLPPGSHRSLIYTDGLSDASVPVAIRCFQKSTGSDDFLVGSGPLARQALKRHTLFGCQLNGDRRPATTMLVAHAIHVTP